MSAYFIFMIMGLCEFENKKPVHRLSFDSGVPVLMLDLAYSLVKTGITAPAILLI
ncbi:hypothetical protein [Nitrosomonas sp.]|uniref:hypothetical protein n=1 Tax=Nitrosomonas sp. TaxID=42353 RepID=UPI0025F10E0D|nr:hypothetical protein [Nitrosomonas sp.]